MPSSLAAARMFCRSLAENKQEKRDTAVRQQGLALSALTMISTNELPEEKANPNGGTELPRFP